MCPRLSNAVSMIIFRCLVMKIQSDEVITCSVIFSHFLFFFYGKYQKIIKNDRKCCNFIRLNFHNQTSKNYHRHGIWKPWTHTFQKNNFGQHLVNRCWLNLYPPFPYQNRAKIGPTSPQTINLVNRCWLNVDQNYFSGKYDIRAFQRRVGRPSIPLSRWDICRGKKNGFLRGPFPGVKYTLNAHANAKNTPKASVFEQYDAP